MSLIINANGEYLSGGGVDFGAIWLTECTFGIWVKRDSGTSTYQSYGYIGRNATEEYGSIVLAHNGSSSDCFLYPSGAGYRVNAFNNAESTLWQLLVLTAKKDTVPKAYVGISGGSLTSVSGTDAVAFAFNSALDNIRIGGGFAVIDGWFPRARLAHCFFYDKELTSGQVAELFNGGTAGAGKNPQAVQAANLKFYAALASDATVTVSGITLSATGTLTYDGADNPNVESFGGGSATSLTLADAGHAHAADNLVLTTTRLLAIADSGHAHAADNIALSVLGTLTVADSLHAHLADSITLTTVVPGTITIPAVRDWGTGALKTGETGVQVDIRNKSTGALVVRKTGQTTHATTGVCVVQDALISAGVNYEVATRFSDGSMGMWDYTAT